MVRRITVLSKGIEKKDMINVTCCKGTAQARLA